MEEDNKKYEVRLKRALISDVDGDEDAIRKIQVIIIWDKNTGKYILEQKIQVNKFWTKKKSILFMSILFYIKFFFYQ